MPRSAPPPAPELAQQQALAAWLNARGVLWCHVPNGGRRDAITGAQLRACGVMPGVPDVLVFTAPPRAPGYVGTAIELKAGKGSRVQRSQQRWLAGLTACRWYAAVCYGVDEAVRLLLRLGY